MRTVCSTATYSRRRLDICTQSCTRSINPEEGLSPSTNAGDEAEKSMKSRGISLSGDLAFPAFALISATITSRRGRLAGGFVLESSKHI